MVKNLNQLKKALRRGVEFEIVLHIRPECIGQIRRVTEANTRGLYSIIPAEPENNINTGNNGFGSHFEWGPAREWTFDAEGVCAKYTNYKDRTNEILIAFKIIGGDEK